MPPDHPLTPAPAAAAPVTAAVPVTAAIPVTAAAPEDPPAALARLVITARPFRGELQGELHARVPAPATRGAITMLGCVAVAALLLLLAPAVLMYLAPRAGLSPGWVTALLAGDLICAAMWLLLRGRGATRAGGNGCRTPRPRRTPQAAHSDRAAVQTTHGRRQPGRLPARPDHRNDRT
ncbi:hypothetical protein ABZT47_17570 [Sphaerisporangium sp. NPDC005289]|uniref:hypothetical protein n=1 Tax=Sphaerisporangium sp. NPDC005289 TaxID=3155247 RepID=UPI0033BAED1D